MRLEFLVLFSVSTSLWAAELTPILFKSTQGFEIQVPRCWKPVINSPDSEGEIENSPDVMFVEGETCQRPKLNIYSPNGVSISSTALYKSKPEMDALVAERLQVLKGRKLQVKLGMTNGNVSIAFVETISKRATRWTTEIYCPNTRMLKIVGPIMDNPGEKNLARIKNGDLSAPDPEYSVIKSTKCIPIK